LRDIANQAGTVCRDRAPGRHLLHRRSPFEDAARVVTKSYAAGSDHAPVQQQWETVTTATKPSPGTSQQRPPCNASLTAIEQESLLPRQADPATRIDLEQAMAISVTRTTDLVELTHTAAQLPEPLIPLPAAVRPSPDTASTMERITTAATEVRTDTA